MNGMVPATLTRVAAALLLGLGVATTANAGPTFTYVGNTFDAATASADMLGRHVVASVTFSDAVLGLTGTVGAAAVLDWLIGIDGLPGTFRTAATGFLHPDWPLWFDFSAGDIVGWQLLAKVAPGDSFPEVYTTRNSPFARINPTTDFYTSDTAGTSYGIRIDAPGTWTLAAVVPIPSTGVLAVAGLVILLGSARQRLRS